MLLVKGGVAGSGPVGFRVFVVVDLFFGYGTGGMKILIDLSNLRIFDQIAIEHNLLFLKHRMDPYF